MFTLGENITNFRNQNGWNQEKFARNFNSFLKEQGIKNAKYNNRTISQWENNTRDPKSLEILFYLAMFMNTTIDELCAKKISTFASAAETMKASYIDDNTAFETYCAILGIYAYDNEKQCFLTRFVWSTDYLETTEENVIGFKESMCPYFASPDDIEEAILLSDENCISEEDMLHSAYEKLRHRYSSWAEFKKDWDIHTSDQYSSDVMKSYWECFMDEANLNPNNIKTKTHYLDTNVCTCLIETSAELYISKDKYLNTLRQIFANWLPIPYDIGQDGEQISSIKFDLSKNLPSLTRVLQHYTLFSNYNYSI